MRVLKSDTCLLKVALRAVEPRLQIGDPLSDESQMAQDLLLVETLPHDPERWRRSDGICRRETWLREIWLGGLGLGLLHDPSLHDVKEVTPTRVIPTYFVRCNPG